MVSRERIANPAEGGTFRVRYIVYAALAVLVLMAVCSYSSPEDAAALSGGSSRPPANWIGYTGAWIGFWSFHLFGLATYMIVLLMLLRTIRCFVPARPPRFWKSFAGGVLAVFGAMLLLALTPEPFAGMTDRLGIGRKEVPQLALSGGVIGQWLAAPAVYRTDGGDDAEAMPQLPEGWLRQLIGAPGMLISAWTLLAVGGVMIFLSDWAAVVFHLSVAPPEERSRRRRDEEPEEDVRDEEEEKEEEAEKAPRRGRFSAIARMLRLANEADSDAEAETPKAAAEPEKPAETVAPPPPPAEPEPEPETETPPPPEATATPETMLRRGTDLKVAAAGNGEHRRVPIFGAYELPSIKMLTQGEVSAGEDKEEIFRARDILQQTLESFEIPGEVTGYTSGPRVTRFEITLAPGVNVKKVEQIESNIAMNLSADRVRVLAPIPGRPVVGVEVSNTKSEAVFMRSVMESEAWQNGKADIPIALGKDVAGKPVVVDLAKAPHLLVAGATGTGKSVCTNTLIMSLLFKFSPDDLKLIMVDPKIVEFEEYRELPHLLAPLINDSGKVPVALRWVANEMDRRYGVMAKVHVKKLSEFNRRPPDPEPVYDADGNEIPPKMPYLVVVIDELADLMMTEAKKDVETNITRIAQKGRAAGIHIVVATQRPSTNIITGVIKANLPTRFCFQVRSGVDSRVVIDTIGAEKLLGKGDMLLMSPSSMVIERVQGAFVPDSDIRKIVEFVCGQAKPSFNSAVLTETAEDGEEIDELDLEEPDDQDRADIAPLIKKYLRSSDGEEMRKALEVVILDRKVSTSYLQRRLKIGYNRAAEIVELLEERQVVGPPSGSGNKREILIFDGTDFADQDGSM